MATQGSQTNAKDSTLYYAERAGGAFSVLATDLSQYLDNQTAGASWAYESSPASRFNVTDYWCVEVEFDCDNTDTGRFVNYGTTAGNSALALRYGNTTGTVDAIMSSGGVATVVGQLALPDVSGSDQRFVFAWASEPNPFTTGAADAMRSEMRAWNITAGTYAQSVFTHYARTAGTSDFVWWANSTAGTNAFSGTPHMCRFSAGRFITATETHEDFVATTSAPTITGQTRIEFPMVDRACALLEPGELAGPVLAMGAASVRDNGLRTLSPIVNENFQELTTYSGSGLTGAPTQRSRAAPDPLYTMLGAYLYYRPVPAFADRLKVRVNVQQWRTSGATADRVHLRVYSMNRPPQPVEDVVDDNEALRVQQASGSIATSHGSGSAAGGWVDLGLMPVARNSEGATWLVLAVRIEDLSGTVANNRLRINAITIEPVLTDE